MPSHGSGNLLKSTRWIDPAGSIKNELAGRADGQLIAAPGSADNGRKICILGTLLASKWLGGKMIELLSGPLVAPEKLFQSTI